MGAGGKEAELTYEEVLCVLDSLHEGIELCDVRGTVIYTNRAFLQIMGLEQEQRLGKNIVELNPGGLLSTVIRTGQSVVGVRTRSPGASREVVATAVPVMRGSQMVGAVAIVHDISELVSLARKLEKASEVIQALYGQVGKATHTFSDILGQSRPIKRAIDVARQAAETDCPVLVTGETGTGKELFAQAIHNSSPRSGNPFIALNCCALTPTLAESELFGHEKGAFTGAAQRRIGLFELAANGTLFLDEVGDLPLELQGKLLRVLQEGEFRRVGGTAVLRSQARIIAATNRDLMSLVGEGLFREDLFFRLNVFHVHVPPLRERRDDIPLLATRFLAHLAARARVDGVPVLSESAVRVLMQYEWPGNVRELHNVLERAFWATKGAKHIGPNVVLPLLRLCSPGQGHGRYVRRLEDVEKEEIVKALSVFGDTVEGKKAAAQALGIALSTLYAKMKQIGEIGEGTRARARVRFPEIRSNCARKCRR